MRGRPQGCAAAPNCTFVVQHHKERGSIRLVLGHGCARAGHARTETCDSREAIMLRTLLYVTTHLSDWHVAHLRCLWPAAARQAPLLREADVIIFNSGRRDSASSRWLRLARSWHQRAIVATHLS